jgi:hypothetical protein
MPATLPPCSQYKSGKERQSPPTSTYGKAYRAKNSGYTQEQISDLARQRKK